MKTQLDLYQSASAAAIAALAQTTDRGVLAAKLAAMEAVAPADERQWSDYFESCLQQYRVMSQQTLASAKQTPAPAATS